MPPRPADDVALLRTAGLRVTAPRLAVLSSVRELDHPDVECICQDPRRS